jgi:hypothetical protein
MSGYCISCHEPTCNSSPLILTKLYYGDKAKDFLLQYNIVDSVTDDSDVCSKCLAVILTCDNLLNLFWENIKKFKKAAQTRAGPVVRLEILDHHRVNVRKKIEILVFGIDLIVILVFPPKGSKSFGR